MVEFVWRVFQALLVFSRTSCKGPASGENSETLSPLHSQLLVICLSWDFSAFVESNCESSTVSSVRRMRGLSGVRTLLVFLVTCFNVEPLFETLKREKNNGKMK